MKYNILLLNSAPVKRAELTCLMRESIIQKIIVMCLNIETNKKLYLGIGINTRKKVPRHNI